jgi:hypothetical protein
MGTRWGLDSVADPYSDEDRWKQRFQEKRKPSLPTTDDTCEVSQSIETVDSVVRAEYVVNQVLAVAPTVILVGMIVASAFSLFGLAVVGFVSGVAATSGAAVWAFSRQ